VRWNPEINAGAMLQAGTVAVGLVVYLSAGIGRADQTQREIVSVRAEIAAGLSRVEASVNSLQAQIRDIPDINARMTAAERRLTQIDAQAQQLETRIGRVADTVVEVRAELNSITRASGANLPGVTARPTR
jgi:uncharacterized protein involved in exopolysaccharide biosynthesis